MNELSRRRLLAGTGTAFAGLLAGCSSSAEETDEPEADGENDDPDTEPDDGTTDDGDSDDAGSDDADETDETILGEIGIENVHDEKHTVDVIVEVDGDIEHWTTHDLEAGGGATLERDWPTDPSSFRVIVRLDDTELTQISPSRWNDPSCLNLLALIGRDGTLSVLGGTDGGPCGDGEASFG